MGKVCLIRCPSPFLLEERAFPPMGLISVGTVLRQRGHEVTIHDGSLESIPRGCDVYGLGPTAPEYPHAMRVKAFLRGREASTSVIVGGAHATLNPEAVLRDGWDCVVAGDGEVAAVRAVEEPARFVREEDRPLDEYPIPDRTLVDIWRYGDTLEGRHATSLLTARGCPFQCGFCCKNHDRVRLQSAERAIKEIRYVHDLGFRAAAFTEDIFILQPPRTAAICAELKALGFLWRCQVRADLCVRHGPDFLRMMADAGCRWVGMGIESGSPRILETIQKGETVETIEAGVRLLQGAGIKVKGYFVVGLPGESPETLAETRAFMERAGLDDADFKILQPYPGSPIWDHRERYDVSWNGTELEHSWYKGHRGVYRGSLRTSALTTGQLVAAWTELAGRWERRNREGQA